MLTKQEKKLVMFLAGAVLLGMGVDFFSKANARVEKIAKADYALSKININTATAEDLIDSKAASAKLSRQIIDYRIARGGFSDLEQLKEIKGIGVKRYRELEELLYVE